MGSMVHDNIEGSNQKYKTKADESHRFHSFKGEFVMVHPKKGNFLRVLILSSKTETLGRPCQILKKISNNAYTVDL